MPPLLPMRSLLLALSLAGCVGVSTAPAPDTGATVSTPSDSLTAAVERAAQVYFEAAPQSVGLSVGVVVGDEIRTYHFGTVAPGSRERPADGTLYAFGSITKTVTAALLARAHLDGRLALDSDARGHLDGSYFNLEYDVHPIAVAHLVNHTSGLPNTLPDRPEMYPDFPAYEGDPVPWFERVSAVSSAYTRADFFSDLRAVRLDTIPGTRFAYSNAGAQLAGFILERLYGRSYQALVDSFVTAPLGMTDTGLALDADDASRLATGYDENGRPMPPVPAGLGAAGGLKGTILDLARYARWQLDETDPVVRLSHTPPGGEAADPESGYAAGLNWQMLRSADGIRRVWQDGNVPGFTARVVVYPELGIGVVVLANELDPSVPEQTDALADAVLESLDARAFSFWEAM